VGKFSQLKIRGAPLKFAPEVFAAELGEWINFREPPDDDVLAAILKNDLARVIALTAGPNTWMLVQATLRWLWNFAPPGSYGSAEAFKTWRDSGGAEPHPHRRRAS
jgi:hypothetical protein